MTQTNRHPKKKGGLPEEPKTSPQSYLTALINTPETKAAAGAGSAAKSCEGAEKAAPDAGKKPMLKQVSIDADFVIRFQKYALEERGTVRINSLINEILLDFLEKNGY